MQTKTTTKATAVSMKKIESRLRSADKVLSLALDVFDIDDQEYQQDNNDNNKCENQSCGTGHSSLPPLDEITVVSASEGLDDDETASDVSFSSDTDMATEEMNNDAKQLSYRSIFKKYWDTNGGAPSIRRHYAWDRTDDVNKEPRLDGVRKQEQGSKDLDPLVEFQNDNRDLLRQPQQRRSIFGNGCVSSRSFPTMSVSQSPQPCLRAKATSAPSLTGKPTKSCLRKSRFTTGEQLKRSASIDSSTTVVSFKKEVDIIMYEKPMERWAAPGWQSWFH